MNERMKEIKILNIILRNDVALIAIKSTLDWPYQGYQDAALPSISCNSRGINFRKKFSEKYSDMILIGLCLFVVKKNRHTRQNKKDWRYRIRKIHTLQ